MNLRLKILLTLIVVFSLFVVIDSAIHQFVVFPRFLALEQYEARQNVARCHEAFEHDLTHLDFFVHGRERWSELDKQLHDNPSAEPIADRLAAAADAGELDLVALVDGDGTVIHQRIFGQTNGPSPLASFPSARWPRTHPLIQVATSAESGRVRTRSGLMASELGPMQVIAGARPVEGEEGQPSRVLVIGRLLDPGAMSTLASRTATNFHATPISQLTDVELSRLPSELQEFLSRGRGGGDAPIALTTIDSSQLAVQSVISDLAGNPLLVTRAIVPRSIAQHGQIAMRYAIGSLLVAAFLVLTILLILLQPIVISPLTALAQHASNIGKTGDLTVRSQLKRSDEFGDLSRHFDAMVENLAETQSRLIELSRKAGMSDAATGVIHNVGNVITNVNVLSSSMTHRLETSKLAGLKKSTELLRAHESELAEFLVSDPRGQKLPSYICQVTDHVEREHLEILEQLRSMSANLEHVTQLLSAQQKLATGESVLEPVRLERLVQDAIEMLQASLDGHEVQIRWECEEPAVVRVDRGKVIQILVNLIANAKDAVKDLDIDRRELRIHVAAVAPNRIAFAVTDRGCGIAPENMKRIFSSGFTTKTNGHGHGLHFCAIAAKELNGSLQVASEGLECGAMFTLTLPRIPVREKVSS